MTASKIDYTKFVQETSDLFLQGIAAQGLATSAYSTLVVLERPAGLPLPEQGSLRVLIVAPHPDDECLMGGYALRMQEEWGAKVFVLPLSYGSNVNRQEQRREELKKSVSELGFTLVEARARMESEYFPLDDVSLLQVMQDLEPQIVFSPHSDDRHPMHREAHSATHLALNQYLSGSSPHQKDLLWVQTEFWHPMLFPNLLVPFSVDQVAQLGTALSCHQGEIARNPYHLRFPAWLMDSVRRGSEVVSGPGQTAAGASAVSAVFGQLYFQKILSSN